MNLNQKYWTYYKHPRTNFVQVLEAVWTDSYVDNLRAHEKRIFDTEVQARKASEVK